MVAEPATSLACFICHASTLPAALLCLPRPHPFLLLATDRTPFNGCRKQAIIMSSPPPSTGTTDTKRPPGGPPQQQQQQQQQQREAEAEEAAAVRAVENVGVALDNISAQLDPLFAVPWDTLVSRSVCVCWCTKVVALITTGGEGTQASSHDRHTTV